jgi:hypothetical protein
MINFLYFTIKQMKTYYVEERATVIIQHQVQAKSKKQAIELVKNGEQDKTNILEYLDADGIDIVDV